MPSPLSLCGNISDSINHVTGEIAPCWKAKNVTVKDRTIYGSAGDPSIVREKIPISSNAMVVPIWPVINIGRRPTRPSSQIPTNVATTDMTPFAILPINAALVSKPASFNISVP